MSADQQELVFELAVEVVDSFEKLDILVRIATATPLSIEGEDMATALAQLVAAGVVTSGPAGYLVAEGPWSSHIGALASLYQSDRMQVVTLMSKASLQRLRAQAARAFADAFVISPRKKKKGDDHDR